MRWTLFFVALALSATALVGCGGGGGSADESSAGQVGATVALEPGANPIGPDGGTYVVYMTSGTKELDVPIKAEVVGSQLAARLSASGPVTVTITGAVQAGAELVVGDLLAQVDLEDEITELELSPGESDYLLLDVEGFSGGPRCRLGAFIRPVE